MKLKDLNPFFYEFYMERNGRNEFIDLHLHTNYSDGYLDCNSLRRYLEKTSYLMAVTDHNDIRGNIMLRKMGINVVPGLELGCIDGFELLVYFKTEDDMIYFYKSYVEPNINTYRMAKTYKDVNYYLRVLGGFDCYISIPHIAGMAQKNFIKNKPYIYNVIDRVNAIEVHNDALPIARNDIARNIQKKYNKDMTFGSDAHFMREIIRFNSKINNNSREGHFVEDYTDKMKLIGWLGKKHLSHGIKGVLTKTKLT